MHTDEVTGPFDRRLLGTNVPAWLSPDLVADPEFRALTVASGTTLLRLPGGSWSDDYDWLGCELGDPQQCDWTWAMRPSDFVDLLEATGLPADVDGLDQRDRGGSRRGGGVLQRRRR